MSLKNSLLTAACILLCARPALAWQDSFENCTGNRLPSGWVSEGEVLLSDRGAGSMWLSCGSSKLTEHCTASRASDGVDSVTARIQVSNAVYSANAWLYVEGYREGGTQKASSWAKLHRNQGYTDIMFGFDGNGLRVEPVVPGGPEIKPDSPIDLQITVLDGTATAFFWKYAEEKNWRKMGVYKRSPDQPAKDFRPLVSPKQTVESVRLLVSPQAFVSRVEGHKTDPKEKAALLSAAEYYWKQ